MAIFKFQTMLIDDHLSAVNLEVPFELAVTMFYTTKRNQDKEWTFFLNLN